MNEVGSGEPSKGLPDSSPSMPCRYRDLAVTRFCKSNEASNPDFRTLYIPVFKSWQPSQKNAKPTSVSCTLFAGSPVCDQGFELTFGWGHCIRTLPSCSREQTVSEHVMLEGWPCTAVLWVCCGSHWILTICGGSEEGVVGCLVANLRQELWDSSRKWSPRIRFHTHT